MNVARKREGEEKGIILDPQMLEGDDLVYLIQ